MDTPQSSTSAPRPAPASAPGGLLACAALAAFALGALYLLACVASALWLRHAVPLDAQDLRDAAWLSSYTTAMHFSGVLGAALAVTWVLMSLALAVARQSAMPLLLAAAAGLFSWAHQEDTLVRVGVLAGHVRIGCFVPEALECREMLGLPAAGAVSRYNPPALRDGEGLNAAWYQARIDALPASVRTAALEFSLPGASMLATPWVALNADVLRERLAEQHAELALLRGAAVSR